jgi:hypothetical protein
MKLFSLERNIILCAAADLEKIILEKVAILVGHVK